MVSLNVQDATNSNTRVNLSLKKRARFLHKLICHSINHLRWPITYSNLTIFYHVQTNYFQITISELVFIAMASVDVKITQLHERDVHVIVGRNR